MKQVLFGAAAALALVAPGVAAAQTNGNVAFSFNTLDDDFDDDKEDYIALNGAVTTPLSGAWNLQFDADLGDMNHSGHTDSFAGALAHAFVRNDSYAIGGFAGLVDGQTHGYVLGAEGALYLDRVTLAGSAFIGGDREDDDTSLSGFAAAATYFVSDRFSVSVDANLYEFEFFFADQDGAIYGVSAEYQFANAISVFGGYHLSDEDYFGVDKEVNSLTLGVRYNFGTSSLLERDRSGASMIGAGQFTRTNIFAW